MANPADIADLEALWRPLGPDEIAGAAAWLDAAWAVLKIESPGIEQRVDAGTIDPAVVRTVMCSMVLRVLRNPDGRRQGAESIDDYSTSWTLDDRVSSGALYVSPIELGWLAGRRGGPRAYSVMPS